MGSNIIRGGAAGGGGGGGGVVKSAVTNGQTNQNTYNNDIIINNFDSNNNLIADNYVNSNIDYDSKDKKKKSNRKCRRSKQSSSLSLSASVSDLQLEELDIVGGGSPSNYEGTVGGRVDISLPKSQVMEMILQGNGYLIQNRRSNNSDVHRKVHYSPDCLVGGDSVATSRISKDLASCQLNGSHSRKRCFVSHLPEEEISHKIANAHLFKASFRVNAYNRMEAYCKIEGVQTDILLNGLQSQNRAFEGDIVAIEVDPPFAWPKMKGFTAAINSCSSVDECPLPTETVKLDQDSVKGKNKVDSEFVYSGSGDQHGNIYNSGEKNDADPSGSCSTKSNHLVASDIIGESDFACEAVDTLSAIVNENPSKRPTGRVVGIIERSPQRDTIVGYLDVKQWNLRRDNNRNEFKKNSQLAQNCEYIFLIPVDPRFPRMMVSLNGLPDYVEKRLNGGGLEMDLVAARVVNWGEESYLPEARVVHIFGKGGEIEAHIASILFKNGIDTSEFSPDVLSCLPCLPWQIPPEEYKRRRDFRNVCVFTIDPTTATDLDDALSIEKLSNGTYQVGVHIADASYFVLPGTALDDDAQNRSTSVYLLQRKLPMLPPSLSEGLCSLNPGVDRLTFSILWDFDSSGKIVDRWIGRSIIRSCCKLSYDHAQDIIDGVFDSQTASAAETNLPKLHGKFEWSDVIKAVKSLHQISRGLKESRFNDGALSLESPKIVFLFDEDGIPYDSVLGGRKDSNFLVEEYMLLANRTAAEVITRAYPSCALLRRHSEPNLRKLKSFEAFCSKYGLELDVSSSGQLHQSLGRIKGELKNDSVLFDILMSYAVKPMQLAAYFSSGDSKESENGWGHYALAIPLYTHFTSPLRRYPDIVVHRTLAAAVETEELYLYHQRSSQLRGCFTGVCYDGDALNSSKAQEILCEAASKHRVPCNDILAGIAEHCNERKLATRHVKDAIEKLYMWVLLKKKEILFSEARVLGLGPKFMSIYICKLAIERRICYDDTEGLIAEWLDTTSTLVLSQPINKRIIRRGGSPGKGKALEEVALVVDPMDAESNLDVFGLYSKGDSGSLVEGNITNTCESEAIKVEPEVFPLTLRLLSKLPVALHAIGGDDGPLDIAARLYASSYFK